MAFSVQMPELGESVTEGTVTRWLKQEGDTVEVDEPLVEVSTDKVDTEIPSPAAGVLTKIVAQEDDTVEVGGELAVIGGDESDGDDSGDESDAPGKDESEAEAAAALDRQGQRVQSGNRAQRHRQHRDITKPVQPYDGAQDRARIAPRLDGIDPALRRGAGEQLGELPGMRADIEDDGRRGHEPRDGRGECAVMLLRRGLEEMSKGAARQPPPIRVDLQRHRSLRPDQRSSRCLSLPLNTLVDGLDSHRLPPCGQSTPRASASKAVLPAPTAAACQQGRGRYSRRDHLDEGR